jgi:hypothetical protein
MPAITNNNLVYWHGWVRPDKSKFQISINMEMIWQENRQITDYVFIKNNTQTQQLILHNNNLTSSHTKQNLQQWQQYQFEYYDKFTQSP